MKNKFTIGVITGMAALTAAVPVIAQISSAASPAATVTPPTASPNTDRPDHVVPGSTQASVQDMITRDNAFLTNADAMLVVLKSAKQSHLASLTAAASIADDTQREAAVKQANDAERVTIEAAITANPNLKGVMMPFGGGHHGGHGDFGHGPGDLAAKLGMTETELKAAIDSGKTIQQIATEKGVTLPARPAFGGRGHGGPMDNDNDADDQAAPTPTAATAQ